MKYVWISAAAIATIAACGGSDDTATSTTTGGGSGCIDFASAPTGVSFAKDVIPIFQTSCNFGACHGSDSSSPQENLALGKGKGETMSASEITEIRDAIVGAASERSSLPMVTAGDPASSWLLLKMVYSNFGACQAIADTCEASGCGSRMPLNSPAIEQASIDAIAGWIKDGAKDN